MIKNKQYEYIIGADHILVVTVNISDAVEVNHGCPMEDAEEPCDAECEIVSCTLNGVEFETDGLYVLDGVDVFKNPRYQDLDGAIKDKILAGDCDEV